MAGTFTRTSPKRADQTIYWPVDLGPWLRSVYDTLGALPGAVVVSNAPDLVESYTVANDLVSLTLAGGLAGTTYRVAVTATSSRGMTRTFIVECAVLGTAAASSGAGGVSDHGALTGLGDDDHAQYLTSGRGDARYSQLGHSHTVAINLDDLLDVNVAGAADGLVLKKVGGVWVAAADIGGGGGATLADGNYGDVTVGSGGAVISVNSGAVQFAELAGQPTTLAGYGITDAAAAGHTHAYGALTGLPSLGTAAPLNVAAAGDAAAGEVVKGNDSRLTDARAALAHSHPATGISDSTAAGRSMLTAADAAAQRGLLNVADGATANATDAALRDRASHTGTQIAATISDLPAAVRAQVEAMLLQGANVTLTGAGAGATRTLTIAAAGGGGGATLADGVYGDVTVSGSGTVITINSGAVTFAEVGAKPTTIAGYGITDALGLSSTAPLINGTAAAGTGTTAARGDHVHPTDTTRAPLASPTFTGTPAAPTAAADTSTTQLATTAFVVGQAGASAPLINGTAAAGTSPRFARQDHVHPTDTGRAAASHQHAISADITGLGANVATFLATPSSANLRAAITDEEGDGALMFVQSPATLSAATNLTRAAHGNRFLTVSAAVALTVEDDTTGAWVGGDSIYGVNSSGGNVTLQGDGTATVTAEAGSTLTVPAGALWSLLRVGANAWRGGAATSAGGGDASTNTATSVDSEVALFSGTTGKTLKRATGTGVAKLAAGVMSAGTVALATEVSGTLPVGSGGTGGATAAAARTALGLAIGTDVQAFSALLGQIAGITFAQGDIIYHNGTALVKLPAGTSGQFLQTAGAGANPAWATLAGGGNVSNSGAPTAGQAAEWVTSTTVQGVAVTGTGSYAKATSPSLTTPAIAGGTLSGITAFALRNAGTGAFDMTQAHNGTLTAARTLTWNLNDAARTISLSANLTVNAATTISAAGAALLDDADAAAQRTTLSAAARAQAIDIAASFPGTSAANGTVVLVQKARFAFTITEVTAQSDSGTITAQATIDGVNVTGGSVNVTSTEASSTPTAANAVAVGQTVAIVLSANATVSGLRVSLGGTRTLD